MQTYESLFITPPTLTEDEERETIEAMARVVADGGGSMVANDRLGRRRLAYPILKHADGIYVRFLYDAEAAVPKELERRMRISDKILRVLTVRLDPDWADHAKKQVVLDAEARAAALLQEQTGPAPSPWGEEPEGMRRRDAFASSDDKEDEDLDESDDRDRDRGRD
jgi:small subunit ribosomal protein S6